MAGLDIFEYDAIGTDKCRFSDRDVAQHTCASSEFDSGLDNRITVKTASPVDVISDRDSLPENDILLETSIFTNDDPVAVMYCQIFSDGRTGGQFDTNQ